MKLQPPDDDIRLQRLNRPTTEQGVESRPLEQPDPVTPPPRIEETREHVRRTPADRRQGERRQQDKPVLLDTRSGRERRGAGRRQVDQENATPHEPRPTRISIKA